MRDSRHPGPGIRTLIRGVLPACRDVDPNRISAAVVPVGVLVAGSYWAGAHGRPGLYLVAVVLIVARMFLGTLDGLVATHYGKVTAAGAMANRLASELCDVLCLVALALARPEWMVPGILALALAWLVSFAGLVGAIAGQPPQTVGPGGQTERLASLQILSLLAFLSERHGWGVDFLQAFLWWVAGGGALTAWLRLTRHFRGARAAAQRAVSAGVG